MVRESAHSVLGPLDQRLVAALQWDGRLGAERAAEVLGVGRRPSAAGCGR
ncbi:hypothetical protein [Kitasatospora fiedleri]|nr:hypothetical protein [Kitasatospora fiedleri]